VSITTARPAVREPASLMSPAAFRNAGLLMLRLVVGATFLVHGLDKLIDQGFFVDEGGFELVLPLGGASLAIALTGAGRFSVDAHV
jgi:putative oxidoreductase